MEIIKPTAMDAWKEVLDSILRKGSDFRDNQNRLCRELTCLSVTINHPDVGIDEPMSLIKKFNKWIYPSKDELLNIIFNKDELPLYDYTYGNRIFNHGNSFDQINNYIIPLLKKDPATRRGVVMLVDPNIDLNLVGKNSPCLIMLHFKISKNRLLLTSIIRSNDFFIGWPANIFQLASLQEYVAKKLSIRQGDLTTYSISSHIFEEYFSDIEKVLLS